ncbi:hypothetical protein [Pedobacter jejuensis]|uniref:Uncharacterized protein n=1 Tax=Pedobacter jejuensis TaxID=1268550 RepID=A0A3N0C215_9SPHI|nr:hypothetical protein [Pedobacter jejuensis]RNL56472.1 hypothetical protein D7004_00865 [Pedobacter jejuensis]
MQTDSIFIAHPTTTDQIEALKAVVKAFNVKFEIKKDLSKKIAKSKNTQVYEDLKQGFKEVGFIQKGKMSGTSLEDFLNEV